MTGPAEGPDSAALARVARLLRDRAGLRTADSRLPALEHAVHRLAPGRGAAEVATAIERPGGETLLAGLIDEVTVRETYFFREPRQLAELDWDALLALARDHGAREIRIWVPGCSSGEDAYLLAMLASEAFRPRPPPVSILGTDISHAALAQASEGAYGDRSVRGLPAELRERYLAPHDGRHRVAETLRSPVRFRAHNLAADPFPPSGEVGFDLIACRNVLIYLADDVVPRVLAGFEAALRPGGRLVLGSADMLSAAAARPRAPESPAAGRRAPVPPRAPRPVAEEPVEASTHLVRGRRELAAGRPEEAIAALRRALYVDPDLATAAYELGRAHESQGDLRAARRAYERALRTIAAAGEPRATEDSAGLASACRARLAAIGMTERAG